MSCPICSAQSDARYRPFCSKRCADLDLAKWFSGAYSVPSEDPDDVEEALDAALAVRARDGDQGGGESTH